MKKPDSLLYISNGYIQQHFDWCWVVCVQFISNSLTTNKNTENTKYTQFIFSEKIQPDRGFRDKYLHCDVHYNRYIFKYQAEIIENAFSQPQESYISDDEMKMMALKQKLCQNNIHKYNIGVYGNYYLKDIDIIAIEMMLDRNYFLIGNYRVQGTHIFHSIVMFRLNKYNGDILVLDPWDGGIYTFSINDLFIKGFTTSIGKGIIRWVQYVGIGSVQ